MSLLETSIKLLEHDETVLSAREVERGLAFVDSLAAHTTSKNLRRDLDTVRKQLKLSTNKSVGKALKQLVGTPRFQRNQKIATEVVSAASYL